MVETRLQRKRRQMDLFGQDTNMYSFSNDMNKNMDLGVPLINPFNDMNMPSSSHNPFEPFIHRDENGHVFVEDLEVATKNPEVASFVEELVLQDSEKYLAMFLHQGAKFPHGFDINTLRAASPNHDANNNINNTSNTSQPQNNANNTIGATTQSATNTINATSNSTSNQNTSNTINATSIGGASTMSQDKSQSIPQMSIASSQSIGATFGSSTMGGKFFKPLIWSFI